MALGGPGGRSPKYLINIMHVGYQFYSVFSTENKSRVDTSLRFQIRLQQGDPWGSLGPLGRGGGKDVFKRTYHLTLAAVVVQMKIAAFSSSKAEMKLVARFCERHQLNQPTRYPRQGSFATCQGYYNNLCH